MKKVHIFTDASEASLLKQLPGSATVYKGFVLSVGLEIPDDCDVIIVWNRSEIGITTHLPQSRIGFIMAEPEVVRPISNAFLNQFGHVVSPASKRLNVPHSKRSPCWPWYAGVNFSRPETKDSVKGYDFFKSYRPEKKTPKVSIVTSKRSSLPQHLKRLDFIDKLTKIIPQHIKVFGRDIMPIDDKFDALAPFQYHLALENTTAPDSWTEKLADPLLCWTHPFYVGCSNANKYIPDGSFTPLNIDDPEGAADKILRAIENNHWETQLDAMANAREILLEKENASQIIIELAQALFELPACGDANAPHRLNSDKSMFAEKRRVSDWVLCALLKIILLYDRNAELKYWQRASASN